MTQFKACIWALDTREFWGNWTKIKVTQSSHEESFWSWQKVVALNSNISHSLKWERILFDTGILWNVTCV